MRVAQDVLCILLILVASCADKDTSSNGSPTLEESDTTQEEANQALLTAILNKDVAEL